MRKLLLSLICLAFLPLMANAEQAVITFGSSQYEDDLELTSLNLTDVSSDVDYTVGDACSIMFSKGSSSAPPVIGTSYYRLYWKNIMTVTPKAGVVISKVTINCTAASYGSNRPVVVSSGTTAADGASIVWSGNLTSASTLIQQTQTSGHIRIKWILFEYTKGETKSVETPEITLADNNMVNITCATEGADIYYTTDGNEPSASSNKYTAPFAITEATEVKAIAIKDGESSYVASTTLSLNTVNSIADFLTLKSSSAVKINCPITAIYQNNNHLYVTDGSDYILVYGTNDAATDVVNGDVFSYITGSYTTYSGLSELKPTAFGEKTTGTAVEPTEYGLDELSTSMLSHYVKLTDVTIKADNTGGINYTISDADGSNPTAIYNTYAPSNNKGYTAVEIPEGTGFTVIGFVSCYNSTLQIQPIEVTGGTVIETVETPVITPNGGDLKVGDKITIECATKGATIYYTTEEGETPSKESMVYNNEITFTDAMTLKAIAVKDGMFDSEIASATFTVAVEGTHYAMFDFTNDGNAATTLVTAAQIAASNKQADLNDDGVTTNIVSDLEFKDGPIVLQSIKGTGNVSRWWAATNDTELRVYKNNTLSFRIVEDGYKIGSISFTQIDGTAATKWVINTSACSPIGTWNEKVWMAPAEGLNNEVLIPLSGTTHIATIEVKYVEDPEGLAGINGVIVDNTNAPVEYFNLQGIRVAADNLTPGIYIRRQGTEVSKVLVK